MWVYAHMYVWLSVDGCIYTYIFLFVCIYPYPHTYVSKVCICMYVFMCACIFVYVCVSAYMYRYGSMHAHFIEHKLGTCVWGWEVRSCIWMDIWGHGLYIHSFLSSINMTGLNTTEMALLLPQTDPLPARITEFTPPSISERGNGSSETTYLPGDHSSQVSPDTWIMLVSYYDRVTHQCPYPKWYWGLTCLSKSF